MNKVKYIFSLLLFVSMILSSITAKENVIHLAKLDNQEALQNELSLSFFNDNNAPEPKVKKSESSYAQRLLQIEKKLERVRKQIQILEAEKKNIYLSIENEERIKFQISEATKLSELDSENITEKKSVNSQPSDKDEMISVEEELAIVSDDDGNLENTEITEEPETNSEKVIYLTFDDGPLRGTSNVLKVLEEENVKATMFFVGRHVLNNKSLFKKVLHSQNVLIANHTFSHANGHYSRFYRNGEKLVDDVEKAQDIIGGSKYQRLAGRNVWRLPEVYKNDNGVSKKRRTIEASNYDAVAKDGYYIYGWDIEWSFHHKNGKPIYSAKRMAEKINSCYNCGKVTKKKKLILLAHDFMFRSKYHGKNVLKKLIVLLKKSGWKFDTLKHYTKSEPEYYVRKEKTNSKIKLAENKNILK